MTSTKYIVIGAVLAILTPLWWHEEVVQRLGRVTFDSTFHCLAKIGMGDCGAFWLIGLHQENQIGGIVFWIGIALISTGLWRKYS